MEQRGGEAVELLAMGTDQIGHVVVGVVDQAAHFLVNEPPGGF